MYCSIKGFSNLVITSNHKDIKEIQEIYTNLSKAMEIVKDNEDKRIVFIVNEYNDISDLELLSQTYSSVVFKTETALHANILKEKNLPFFVGDKLWFADTFDKLIFFCNSGVTDVYITGELCFNLDKVKKIVDKYNVKIRVMPNIVQHSGFYTAPHMNSMTGFWIRPNDLNLYEDYIDVIEFYGDSKKQEVLYEIYFEDKNYYGNLGFVVEGLTSIRNENMSSKFTEFRLNCGKKCQLDICHKCDRFKIASDLLEENELELEEEGN